MTELLDRLKQATEDMIEPMDRLKQAHERIFAREDQLMEIARALDTTCADLRAALARVTAERDALREALKETETVYSWLQSFFNDVMSTAPEYVERCGDWNAVQYMMQDCAGVAERTRAALERSAPE